MATSMEESNDNLSEVISEIPNWSATDDVKLLYSMFDRKPVGINKHFHMCIIISEFNELQKSEGLQPVSSDVLWTRLNELYGLPLMEEYESLSLEETDFENLLEQCAWYKKLKTGDDLDEDKPLAKKLVRSESEESKVSGMDLEESNSKVKLTRKRVSRADENISSEEEITKTLRTRGGRTSNVKKSESPSVGKKKK